MKKSRGAELAAKRIKFTWGADFASYLESAPPPKADVSAQSFDVCFVPKADINCRDCDVRSLAGPEPDRQVFAKFKHLLRKAAARSAETICVTIGEILRAFAPAECANDFRNSVYAQS
jgi:hypothetical protein